MQTLICLLLLVPLLSCFVSLRLCKAAWPLRTLVSTPVPLQRPPQMPSSLPFYDTRWQTDEKPYCAKRTNTGKKPYRCDEPGCNYSRQQLSNITVHTRTHKASESDVDTESEYDIDTDVIDVNLLCPTFSWLRRHCG
jgi:hypothetical protein